MLEMKVPRKPRGVLGWLLVTGLLGAGFVGMELHDYYVMITAHGATPQASGFLSAYYLLTGTHALHVSLRAGVDGGHGGAGGGVRPELPR